MCSFLDKQKEQSIREGVCRIWELSQHKMEG